MTPPIPSWMHCFRLPGYTNIYELVPSETRIFGTEDLFGDWNGKLLLLAKDFACSRLARERIAQSEARPYRHEPTLRTNTTLKQLTRNLRLGDHPQTCGMLYGSALAGLLRDDGTMSGSLPNRSAALKYGRKVLGYTIENMPNLRAVVCMGEEAWQAASSCFGVHAAWQDVRDQEGYIQTNGVRLIATYHPAARVSLAKKQHAWNALPDLWTAGQSAQQHKAA